jgi:acetone carboxylase gamma subunit
MAEFDKADIEKLIDGVLPWPATQDMLSSSKDEDRFDKYVEIMQTRVSFDDPILLPLTPQLFIVSAGGERIVKCKCGHSFGDYRVNWKLNALINVRDDEASMSEVYIGREMPDPGWIQLREYICGGCGTQLEVEAVPRGCPPDFDFLPDLDTFYTEWLGRPLPDKVENKDLSLETVSGWAK